MKKKEGFGFLIIKILTTVTVLSFLVIIGFIFIKGIKVMSWSFITKFPENFMTEGGIFPAIVGSFYLVLLSVFFAIVPSVATAIYLNEYSKSRRLARIIKISINNLSAVPSVVYGLFGLGIFVKYLKFGVSMLSGSLTLSIVILPLMISSANEAFMAIPNSLREASMALGATKWFTIKKILLPIAMPSIITGIILSIARAAGETAPILFTAAVFYSPELPHSILSEVMALPYHIYALVTEGTGPEVQVPIAYGASLVLIMLVIILSIAAIVIRERNRRVYDKLGN
jgi:phosphate transport system permease protein